MRWDGKERRKGGRAEELRARIDKLKREWDARKLPPTKTIGARKRRTAPKR